MQSPTHRKPQLCCGEKKPGGKTNPSLALPAASCKTIGICRMQVALPVALCKTFGICTICKLQVGKMVLNHLQQSSSWFALVQNLKMSVLKNMIGPHERTFSSSPSYPCSRTCTLLLLLLPGLQGGVPACLQPSKGPLSPFQVWRRLIVERGRREALCPLTPTCTASPRWWWRGLNWDQRGEVVSLVALEGGRWELDTRVPDIALFTNSTGQLTLVHFEGREFSYWTSSSSGVTFPAQITSANWETRTSNISFTVDTRRPMDLLNTISYFSRSAFETLPPSWLPIARLLREDHGFRDHISQVHLDMRVSLLCLCF